MVVFAEITGVLGPGHPDHVLHPITITPLETRQRQDHVLTWGLETEKETGEISEFISLRN